MTPLGEALAVGVGAGLGWWIGGRRAAREAALLELADELLAVGEVLDRQGAELAAAAAGYPFDPAVAGVPIDPAVIRRPSCLEECCRR